MKFQRSLQDEVGIDLTSLIDVVFLLLIFFMVTTTFTRDSNLLVNLPEAQGQPSSDEPLRIEILVARDGSYSVNGQALANTSVNVLMQAIEALAAGDTTLPVTITADAATDYQSVVTVMDTVARLGLSRVNMATRQAGEAADE